MELESQQWKPKIDKTGLKTGILTITGYSHYVIHGKYNQKRPYWNYRCECGMEGKIHDCRTKIQYSCGCYGGVNPLKEKVAAQRKPWGHTAMQDVRAEYIGRCKKKSIAFELDSQLFFEITQSNCHYCDSPPSSKRMPNPYGLKRATFTDPYIYNGVDRIDPQIGYVKSNCVPCCWRCNSAKNNMTVNEFKQWITKVYEHTIGKL